MKIIPAEELKARFSEILKKVKQGESFGILYGKMKKPIAMIVPYRDQEEKHERHLGILEGKATITFAKDLKYQRKSF